MGFILPALAVASFAATAYSAYSQYSAQKKAAKAQDKSNAAAMKAAEQEASLIREDAKDTAREERKQASRIRGQQIAAYLKSGVTLDGSPLLTISETEEQGKRNAQKTIDNAESRAKSTILRGQAGQKPVQRADIFGTASTVLGSAQTLYKTVG